MKKDSIALFFDNLSKNENLINNYVFMLIINNKLVVSDKPFVKNNINNIIDIVKNHKDKIETFNLSLFENPIIKKSKKNWFENTLTFYNKKLQLYAKLDIKSNNIDTENETIETKIQYSSVDDEIDKMMNLKKFILETNKIITAKYLDFCKS